MASEGGTTNRRTFLGDVMRVAIGAGLVGGVVVLAGRRAEENCDAPTACRACGLFHRCNQPRARALRIQPGNKT